jgi:hypothetical protein
MNQVIDDVRVISLAARRAVRRAAHRGIDDVVQELFPSIDQSPEAEFGRRFGLALTAGVLVFGVGLALFLALTED